MSEATDTPPAEEPVRTGWQLGAESWSFHRTFYRVVGRPAAWGEYTALIVQLRHGIAKPVEEPEWWRVWLLDGTMITVRGGWHTLLRVEAADFRPPRKVADHPPLSPKQLKALAAKAIAKRAAWLAKGTKGAKAKHQKQPVSESSPPAQVVLPPPSRPLRATTLVLGNPAAAQVLATRLRRYGIPLPGPPT